MWDPCQSLPGLQSGRVHVWRAGAADFAARQGRLERLLAPEERRRLERFHFAHHRQAYLVTHALLNLLLGHYLGLQPQQVSLLCNDYGKPAIDFTRTPCALPRFHFNISESRSVALLAFGLDGELGVDVEAWRPDLDFERLANRFFAPGEKQRLLDLPPALRQAAFFHGWTRKEAYMKARGLGFSLSLSAFEVSMHPAEPARLLASSEPGVTVSDYSLFSLEPGAGYAGALASAGPAQVQTLAFTPALLDRLG